MAERSDLITTAAAARRCGIAISTLHRYVAAGRIDHAFRMPGEKGALLFTPDAVEALREELKAEALARFDDEPAAS